MRVDYPRSHELELHSVDRELAGEVTVHAGGDEAGIGEDPAVLRLASRVPPFQVAFHLVPGRVGFQKCHTMDQSGDVTHATLERGIGDVLEHIGADHEVVAMSEREFRQVLERTEAYVTPLPMAGHDVLAGIDADVSDAGAQASEFGEPAPFSGSDVQHGSQIAA